LDFTKEKEMADFRRWITALAVVLLFTGLANAQLPGGGGTSFNCSVNTSSTPTLRSEGITELIGDIVITCTGGNVQPNIGFGATSNPLAPAVNITVSLTSQVTSRLLNSSAVSEALLLVDEPGSGLPPAVFGFGPGQPFTPCPNPSATSNGCAGVGSPTPAYELTQQGNDNGFTGPFQTAVTSACAGGAAACTTATVTSTAILAAPNVYQGVVSGNQVTFYGVPVVPPGTTATRVFRIVNIRVNASGIGGGSASGSLPVQASILTSNPAALPITNPTPIVGFVQQSLSSSVSSVTTFGQCNSQTLCQSTTLSFKELFASAFKTRVDPTVTGQVGGTPASGGGVGQGNALVQTNPQALYSGESGFTLGGLVGSTSANGVAGLADFGTRFTAVFNNIPAGARVFVSQYNITSTSGVLSENLPNGSSSSSSAQAITADTVADGSGTIPAASPFTSLVNSSGCGTSSTGVIHVIEITPSSGNTATASWESVTNSPTAIDTYNFGVFLTYVASPGTNSPAAGTGTVNLRYGPASTVTTASASANVPRFLDTSSAKNAIAIGICRTILLYPFITNQAGFDTGIAISNTSTDPFGTTPQNGTCSLNWYGAAAPPTATTTPSVATATSYTALASVTVPGFQGYMIAVCNFQYAHGFAFISDLGARNLAMGYLPLVVPDPNLNSGRNANDQAMSSASSGEQLSQ
jgi:hypothetical protein